MLPVAMDKSVMMVHAWPVVEMMRAVLQVSSVSKGNAKKHCTYSREGLEFLSRH